MRQKIICAKKYYQRKSVKIYLHIGTEKTGTSTIQEFLFQNRENLMRQGYYYLHMEGRTEYRDLPAYCMNMDRVDRYFKINFIDSKEKRLEFNNRFIIDFHQKMKNLPDHIHTLIISSEHFSSRLRFPDELEKLKQLLRDYTEDITVICYLRNQADKLLSQYSTRVKTGASIKIENFYKNFISSNKNNYESKLDLWGGVFGKNNLEVKIFDKKEFHNNSLLDDFIQIIDKNLLTELNMEISQKNESLSKNGIYFARLVNRIIPAFNHKKGSSKMNRILLDLITRFIKGKPLVLSNSQYNELTGYFASSNEKVRSRYFPQRKSLFNNETSEKV